MMKHKGFTVVELLVVIVVIGLLAAITLVSYSYLKDDGMDTKIRATVKTAADAVAIYESQTGDKAFDANFYHATNGVDKKLIPKYLKPGYRDGLSSKNVRDPKFIFRLYACSTGGFVIYASLNNPTPDDLNRFTTIRSSCGQAAAAVPSSTESSSGERYNYAHTF